MKNFSLQCIEKVSSTKLFHSYASTQSSSSEKSFLAASYKNEPIPNKIQKRLIKNKYSFDYCEEEDEQILTVYEQDQSQLIEKKKNKLPEFKVISDGEFEEERLSTSFYDIRKSSIPRCHSVSSFKLPQVLEERKQEEQRNTLHLSKIAEVRDQNEFGQIRQKSVGQFVTGSKNNLIQNIDGMDQIVQEEIMQNENQEAKQRKPINEKSIITSQLDKLIVDELDQKKKKKDKEIQEIQIDSIIEEDRQEEQDVNTHKLHLSLSKFESEFEYLTNLKDKLPNNDTTIEQSYES